MEGTVAPDNAVRGDAAGAGRVQQAGAVVFRLTTGAPEILLVRAKKDPAHWIFPKGHIEAGETAEAAALREAREEAGIIGRALGEIRALEFTSGKESVRVRYYLVHAMEEGTAEPREKKWFSPSEAVRELTHPDARRLLKDAFPDIENVLIAQGATAAKDPSFQELLLAEYEHLADSLLRNEEDGEKRAAFFITLAGATGAALAFLLDDEKLTPEATNPLVVIALVALLAVGYLTFLRVVRRNVASDGYKRALNRVRRAFVATPGDPRRIFLAFDPFSRERRAKPSWKSLGRGGWLETIALIESLVAGAFVAALIPTPHWICDGGVAGLAALGAWALLLWDASRRYDRADRLP